MAISRNYIQLQRQIADELGDNQALLSPLSDTEGLSSPIQNAIQQAIAKWEREDFYFNQIIIDTPLINLSPPWQTVTGQEYYSDSDWLGPTLSSIAKISKMWILFGGNRFYIEPRTPEYLVDVSVNPGVTGYPTDYAYFAQQVRLYPIPSGIYPVGILGLRRFTALNKDADSNAWTTDAFDLIRCEAKAILAREVLYDAEIETASQKAIYGDPSLPGERGYLYALKAEGSRRSGSPKIVPTYF